MLATLNQHTSLVGWDVVCALLVVLGAVGLEHVVPQVPWFKWLGLFGVALLVFALTVKF